jgi:thioredoxin 1
MSILYTTDDNFDVDVSGHLPTLAVFTAPWCGPCKTLAPILEEIETAYAGRLTIIKVDIDKCTSIPSRFNVKGVPTCMLLKNGVEVGRVLGSVKKSLIDFLDDNI